MSLRSLEAAMLRELKRQPGCSKIRQKDVMEWANREIVAQTGETVAYLSELGLWIAYKDAAKKSDLPQTSADSQARIDGED